MQANVQARSAWIVVLGSFLCAAFFGAAAATLLLQVLSGHGTHAGNFLRIALGILFFVLGVFFITVGMLYRLSFNEERSNTLN